jgi:hypothetical protein
MGKNMHDLAVDAIKTVTDEKKSACDPPLELHRFDDGGAECGSGLWLGERLDFARCSANLPDADSKAHASASANFDLSYLKIDNSNFKRHRVNPAGWVDICATLGESVAT